MSPSQGIPPLPSNPFFPHIRLPGTLQTFRLSTVLVHRILPPTISLLWITCPCPGALLPLPLNLLRMFWRQTASMILLRGLCRVPPNSLGWVSLPRTVLNRRALSPYRTCGKKYSTYQLQYDLLLRPVYSGNQTVVDKMRDKLYFLIHRKFERAYREY
jgi:hypothetical protein